MNRYKIILLIVANLLLYSNGSAQVGIGNTTPSAILDISASNQAAPANNDGILIPRVDAFPATNPTATQDSMLIYLTTDVGANEKGFYYWNFSTLEWIPFNKLEWKDTVSPIPGIVANQANLLGNQVVVTDSGRIGIGTDNPSEALHIDNGDIYMNNQSSPTIEMQSTSGGATPAGRILIEEQDDNWNGQLRFNANPNAWEFLAKSGSNATDNHMLMYIDAENGNKGFVRIGKMDVDSVVDGDLKETLEVLGGIKIEQSKSVTGTISHDSSSNPPAGGAGTMVFQDSDSSFYGWNGTVWKKLDN